jgi:KUP system potassium uptake protein
MVTVVAIVVWRFPIYFVLPVFIIFALWDGAFLSATLNKVPDGAWLTLAIAVILSAIFIIWRFGKEQQWKAEALDSVPLSQTIQIQLAKQQDRPELKLQSALGGAQVMPLKGLGIFFDKAGSASATPLVFLHFLRKFSAMPDVTVFFHLRPLGIPTVPADERFTVNRCYAAGVDDVKRPLPNCYRIIVRHGYTDEIVTPDLGRLVTDHIQSYLLNEEAAMSPQEKKATVEDHDSSASDSALSASSPMADLQQAVADQVVYIVGKEQLRMGSTKNIFRKFFLALFMWLRENTRARVQQLDVEVDRLVEVGFIKDI